MYRCSSRRCFVIVNVYMPDNAVIVKTNSMIAHSLNVPSQPAWSVINCWQWLQPPVLELDRKTSSERTTDLGSLDA